MKRLALMGLLLLVALFISSTVHARRVINEGTYCTEGYAADHPDVCDDTFTTKFFKEKFFGGGPGELGNVLMAKGQGFMLQNVALIEEPISCTTEGCGLPTDDPCYATDWTYKTVYDGGMLTLNSKGPWLDKGMLKAKGFTATNYSRHDVDGNLIGFCMVIAGEFRNAPYSFNAWALFDVTEDNYQFKQDEDGKPVFQRGYDFDALIDISDNSNNTPQ
jgi:hypothetical protein